MDFTERLTKAVLCLTLGGATLVAGCQQEKAVPREVSTRITWREGDLVFRQGTGAAGHAVSLADTGGAYSHVGVVVLRKGEPWVVHAVPGEPDYKGDADRVKIDDLYRFFAPDRASRGAVMRVDGESQAAQRAAQHALALFEAGVLFDHDYNLTDTTQMYCTELVYFVYKKEGVTLADTENTLVIPIINKKCLLPGDLLEGNHLSMLTQFQCSN